MQEYKFKITMKDDTSIEMEAPHNNNFNDIWVKAFKYLESRPQTSSQKNKTYFIFLYFIYSNK
ncbi:MAG: hypothetical protein ACPKQO_03620 [Nitrososphaeraceae archaeon]